MKKAFIFLCKLAASGIFALLILSAITMLYYNPPIATAQPEKYTNSKFLPNTFWSQMEEGFGFGVINDMGYNGTVDFDPSEAEIAFLGSSHTLASEVPQNKSYVSQLQKKLFSDDTQQNDIKCLNLGVSAHFFNVCASNVEYLPESFPALKHVIIETGDLAFSEDVLSKMLAGEYHSDLGDRGVLYTVAQRIPYLRLLYKQYQDVSQPKGSSAGETSFDYAAYEAGMDKVLQKLSNIGKENDFGLTILYHNSLVVENKSASRKDDAQVLEIFKKCCEKYGIGFIDMPDRFVAHFNETYELPYGFANTKPGSGHLNRLGHSLMADALYDYVTGIVEGN